MSENPVAVTQALLPCPICGGDEISHGWSAPGVDGSASTGEVQCHSCDLLLWKETEAEAIAAWNTRAQSPAAGLEREADGAPGGASDDCGNLGWCQTPGQCSRHDETQPASVSGEVVTVPRELTKWMRDQGMRACMEAIYDGSKPVNDGIDDGFKAVDKMWPALLAAAPEAATPSAQEALRFALDHLNADTFTGDAIDQFHEMATAAVTNKSPSAVGGVDRMRDDPDASFQSGHEEGFIAGVAAVMDPRLHHRAIMGCVNLGKWMSAALDDPSVCEEMKADIREWFSSGEPVPGWGALASAEPGK